MQVIHLGGADVYDARRNRGARKKMPEENHRRRHELNRLLIRLQDAMHGEMGLDAALQLMVQEPVYREEVLSRAELLGNDEICTLVREIRRLSGTGPETEQAA
ncbi:MAG: hypothetical protein D6717_11205 [Gammaproteobacteria bacterium]|nr:MAG: hypothetical protein D6717_11205 [Gammaproteobacteria bacterium]